VYGSTRTQRLIAFSDGASSATASGWQQVPGIQLHTESMSHAELGASKDVQAMARSRFVHAGIAKPQQTVAQNRRQNQLENDGFASPATVQVDYPQELSSAPVLVVFHGEQCDPHGRIFWQVMVLRLTSAQRQVLLEGLPKKI